MKLSELHPCDECGGTLLAPSAATFLVVDVQQAMVDGRAVQRMQGMAALWNRPLTDPKALQLAETMGPDQGEAVMLFGEKNPELKTGLFLCMNCGTSLMLLVERRNAAPEAERKGGTGEARRKG